MSRAENFRNDRDNPTAAGGGYAKRHGFFLPDDALAAAGVKLWTGDAGEKGAGAMNYVHILPAHRDDPDLIALPLWGHNQVGPNGDGFLCSAAMKKELERRKLAVPAAIADGRCPICELEARLFKAHMDARDSMSKEDNDASWKQVTSCRCYQGNYKKPAPRRYLAWVVDAASAEAEKEGVQLWPMPTQVFEDGIQELSEDPRNKGADGRPAFVDICDPNAGFVFAFKKSGQKIGTTYAGYRLLPREFSIAKDEPSWLATTPRYMEVLDFASYDEIAAAMGDEPQGQSAPAAEPAPEPGRRYSRSTESAREVSREAIPPSLEPASGATPSAATESASPSESPRRRGYAEGEAEPNPTTAVTESTGGGRTASPEPARRGYAEPAATPTGPSKSEQDAMRERIRKAREARAKTVECAK